jgi:hypothetical protein
MYREPIIATISTALINANIVRPRWGFHYDQAEATSKLTKPQERLGYIVMFFSAPFVSDPFFSPHVT